MVFILGVEGLCRSQALGKTQRCKQLDLPQEGGKGPENKQEKAGGLWHLPERNKTFVLDRFWIPQRAFCGDEHDFWVIEHLFWGWSEHLFWGWFPVLGGLNTFFGEFQWF